MTQLLLQPTLGAQRCSSTSQPPAGSVHLNVVVLDLPHTDYLCIRFLHCCCTQRSSNQQAAGRNIPTAYPAAAADSPLPVLHPLTFLPAQRK
jgi:hypothetical protein